MSAARALLRQISTGKLESAPTLVSIALAGIGAQLSDEVLENDPRLGNIRDAMRSVGNWRQALDRATEAPSSCDGLLVQLSHELPLTAVELLTVALAVDVEFELETGVLLAALQEPAGSVRPTVGLISRLWRDPSGDYVGPLLQGYALRSGLLTLSEAPAPLTERAISVPVPLALTLRGHASQWPGSQSGLTEAQRIPMARSEYQRARGLAASLRTCLDSRLLLRSSSLVEAKSVAAMLAEELKLETLYLSNSPLGGLAPWLRIQKMLPVHCLSLAPGERKAFPQIPEYAGPALALLGTDGELETDGGPVLSSEIAVPTARERESLWLPHLDSPGLAADLAKRYRLRAGRIFDLGRLSSLEAGLNGRKSPCQADIRRVARSGEATGLSCLAELISEEVPDEALIVSAQLRHDLEMLCARCCSRETLADGLGVAARVRYRPSVQALFVGRPGTGKTLAALWLATQLGLPLYRVDLSEISSKYVGETEKNLSRLLSCAEQAGVILLFDEADSVFGRRTDVRDANDRFANAQTNYLLQRMEEYDGITILTSNSRARMDSAFSRRLEMILEFPMPDAEQRRHLWDAHLGTRHSLGEADITYLAVTLELTGGDIRNAVLSAAVQAASRSTQLNLSGVVQGIQGEYRKAGRHVPEDLLRMAARAST
jgi:hypothetical protein